MTPKIFFRPGQEVNGYRVLARLGHGGFASIYFAEYLANGQRIALKLELTNQRKKALKYEREICLKLRGCHYVPEFQRFAETRHILSLAMECLGPSVIALRREAPDSHFSLSTTLRIGIEVIRGLRELHSRGILHRDVKPSNMLVRPSRSRPIALIDFGLSRQFIDPNTGESYPPRIHPGFVGTHYYASPNALRGCEVSQRDDLMSLLFSLVEMRIGRLPWKDAGKNRPLSLALKLSATPEKLFRQCPRQFVALHRIISGYRQGEVPNYDLLIAFLVQAMDEGGCSWTDEFDWDLIPRRKWAKLTPLQWVVPETEAEPNIPTGLPEPVWPEAVEVEEVEEGDVFPRGPVCGGCSLFWCGC